MRSVPRLRKYVNSSSGSIIDCEWLVYENTVHGKIHEKYLLECIRSPVGFPPQ